MPCTPRHRQRRRRRPPGPRSLRHPGRPARSCRRPRKPSPSRPGSRSSPIRRRRARPRRNRRRQEGDAKASAGRRGRVAAGSQRREGALRRRQPASRRRPAAAPPVNVVAARHRCAAGDCRRCRRHQGVAASRAGAARRPGAAGRRGPCHGHRQAGQRRAARDVRVCRGYAGGLVSPRRYGVAGVRFPAADRCRPDPQRGRGADIGCQPVAAGEGTGDPHSSQPPANAFADRRRQGRRALDAHLRRYDAVAATAAGGDPQHHRSGAGQCHRAVVEARPAAPAHRSRSRRYAAGGHGAAAGPRLHQAA